MSHQENRLIWLRRAFLPVALLAALFIRLIAPLLLIRIGPFVSARIGHLVVEPVLAELERRGGVEARGCFGTLDFWFHAGDSCSSTVSRLLARRLWVLPMRPALMVFTCLRLFAHWPRHEAKPIQHDRDIRRLIAKNPPLLRFTAEERLAALRGLRELAIQPGEPFVCLIVRDGAFLPDLDYHRHRDSDIDSYERAALLLARRGYWVLRMGAKVEKPFRARHSKIIDYANDPRRTDFMSIYLAAHCAFAVSTSTGLDAVCQVFRRPICYVNFVPLTYLRTWEPGLAIWKHHVKDDKRMSVGEIVESGAGVFMKAEEYEEAGITLVDNTPEEIEEVVREMLWYHECAPGDEYVTRWDRYAQSAFWSAFPVGENSAFNGQPLHGEVRLRIGSRFLKGYS